MLENRDLLAKNQIFKSETSASTQYRPQGSCENPKPLDHGPNTTRTVWKKATESTRTNIQEAQPHQGRKVMTLQTLPPDDPFEPSAG